MVGKIELNMNWIKSLSFQDPATAKDLTLQSINTQSKNSEYETYNKEADPCQTGIVTSFMHRGPRA